MAYFANKNKNRAFKFSNSVENQVGTMVDMAVFVSDDAERQLQAAEAEGTNPKVPIWPEVMQTEGANQHMPRQRNTTINGDKNRAFNNLGYHKNLIDNLKIASVANGQQPQRVDHTETFVKGGQEVSEERHGYVYYVTAPIAEASKGDGVAHVIDTYNANPLHENAKIPENFFEEQREARDANWAEYQSENARVNKNIEDFKKNAPSKRFEGVSIPSVEVPEAPQAEDDGLEM